jgi:hypothetical protein
MHLTAPSHWSRSIVTGGRDALERPDAIIGMRTARSGSPANSITRHDQQVEKASGHKGLPAHLRSDKGRGRHPREIRGTIAERPESRKYPPD